MSGEEREFERQICRLHQLLECDGSEVTWNSRIPDPDNPSQNRQIDITIRGDDGLTIVECRTHKTKQDVTWIEELIGRRQSLRADTVIAVSASGFTQGALQKANAFGVIVRDLHSLTEEEVRVWGRQTKVWIRFDRFENVFLRLFFDPSLVSQIDVDLVFEALKTEAGRLHGIFECCSSKIAEYGESGRVGTFRALVELPGLFIAGHAVRMVYLEAEHRLVSEERRVSGVMVYGAPNADPTQRVVSIERVDFGRSEIAQAGDQSTFVIDLSAIEVPTDCQFIGLGLEFTRTVTMRAAEFIGLPAFHIPLRNVTVAVSFGEPEAAMLPVKI